MFVALVANLDEFYCVVLSFFLQLSSSVNGNLEEFELITILAVNQVTRDPSRYDTVELTGGTEGFGYQLIIYGVRADDAGRYQCYMQGDTGSVYSGNLICKYHTS